MLAVDGGWPWEGPGVGPEARSRIPKCGRLDGVRRVQTSVWLPTSGISAFVVIRGIIGVEDVIRHKTLVVRVLYYDILRIDITTRNWPILRLEHSHSCFTRTRCMKKILVVDDDDCVLCAVVLGLRRAGFEVTSCASGPEALELAEHVRPDVMLSDIMMPGMDGYAVLHAVRTNPVLRDTPFIFLTGKDSMDDLRTGMDYGADDYVPKSSSIEELVRAIETRVARHEQLRARHAADGPGAIRTPEDLGSLGLSKREAEIMLWVAEGKTNEEIGLILGISRATVRTHLQNIFPKLGVENRVAAAQVVRTRRETTG